MKINYKVKRDTNKMYMNFITQARMITDTDLDSYTPIKFTTKPV